MDDGVPTKRLRILIGEDDEHQGRPLYDVLVRLLRAEGLAGATVLRGIMGFGASSTIRHAGALRLSDDLPVIVECVDTAERIEAVLPVLQERLTEGLITVEPVEVRTIRPTLER